MQWNLEERFKMILGVRVGRHQTYIAIGICKRRRPSHSNSNAILGFSPQFHGMEKEWGVRYLLQIQINKIKHSKPTLALRCLNALK